jgi:hypothetical protein
MTTTNRTGPPSASESETIAPMAVQKNLVIVGATGMVGGNALRYALDHPTVETCDDHRAEKGRYLASRFSISPNGATCWRSLMIATGAPRPLSPAKSQSNIGTTLSATPPSATPCKQTPRHLNMHCGG